MLRGLRGRQGKEAWGIIGTLIHLIEGFSGFVAILRSGVIFPETTKSLRIRDVLKIQEDN